MSTDRLKLYNRALLNLGERSLSSLTENNEHRRSLDQVWDSGEIINEWLLNGLWNFAIRTTERNYDSGVTPDFGMQFAFPKPDDFVRTAGVWTDEYQKAPLTEYKDEAGYWFSVIPTIYVAYVSNDAAYGLDYARWPENFARYCEYDMATKIAKRSASVSDEEFKGMLKVRAQLLAEARNSDAMDEPASFPPEGSWVRSRFPRVNGRNRIRGFQ